MHHGIVGSTRDMPKTTFEVDRAAENCIQTPSAYHVDMSSKAITFRGDGTSHFYPLRTNENTALWANLRALDSTGRKAASQHLPGGKRRSLVLVPHFGGRTRKEKPVEEPYTDQKPCLVKTLGAGPSSLGFYRRPEHLQRQRRYRSNFRGPRRQTWCRAHFCYTSITH